MKYMTSLKNLSPEEIEMYFGNASFDEESHEDVVFGVPLPDVQYEGFLPEWL